MTPLIPKQTKNDKGDPNRAGLLLALGITLAVLIIPWIPEAATTLQWQRGESALVRLLGGITSHLTHWSWDHLIWDLAAFVTLSFASLRLLPERYPLCLLLAAVIIPMEIGLCQLSLETYRGLSGIDSALFGLILVGLWRSPTGSTMSRLIAIGGGALFVIKSIYELMTLDTLFISNSTHDFVPAVSAHLTGMLCGLLAGKVPWQFTGHHPEDRRPDLVSRGEA